MPRRPQTDTRSSQGEEAKPMMINAAMNADGEQVRARSSRRQYCSVFVDSKQMDDGNLTHHHEEWFRLTVIIQ